jgi:succinate dehydrogenase / fumarate reductase cytochrome b subunit
MPVRSRPLSPHLGIYRWQLSNTLSIIHRLTGAGLCVGLLALAYWLVALAGSPAAFAVASGFFAGVPGIVLLAGWTFAFYYHLLNGVRHLFWDAGMGFERTQRTSSGWFVVAGAAVLGAATLLLFWYR